MEGVRIGSQIGDTYGKSPFFQFGKLTKNHYVNGHDVKIATFDVKLKGQPLVTQLFKPDSGPLWLPALRISSESCP